MAPRPQAPRRACDGAPRAARRVRREGPVRGARLRSRHGARRVSPSGRRPDVARGDAGVPGDRGRRPSEVNDFDRAGLLVSLEVRVVNAAERPCRAAIELALTARDTTTPFVVADAGRDDAAAVRWTAENRDDAVGWSDVAAADS